VRWALLIAAGAGALALALAWPRLVPDPLAAGRAAYGQRDWGRAEAEARKRLRERPDDREAWRLLARAEGRQGRDDSAQTIFRQKLGLDAMAAEDYVIAASGLLRGGQAAQARVALEQAKARDPDDPEMLHALARLDAETYRLSEAADLARRLADRPGWEVRGWFMLARYLDQLHDPAGTAEALRQALRLDSTLAGTPALVATARKLLARTLLQVGRPAEARDALADVLARGHDPEASWLLSRALLRQGDVPGATAALASSDGYGDLDPTRPEPAPFVGSARCAECHPSHHRDQQSSRHARTFHPAGKPGSLPSFDGPRVDPNDPHVRHTLRRDGDRLRFETDDGGRLLRAVVDYAFGSGAVAVTMVGHDESGEARELRLTTYGRGGVWDMTTGHVPVPGDRREFLGRPLGRDGLRRCLECHTTNARAAVARSGPVTAERGIGCERCHGPGANHLDAIAARFHEPAVGRPDLATAEQGMAICGACHGPMSSKLAPGDHLAPRFASPSLAWSRCYTESAGALSCVSCHDPHRDAETSAAHYEARCLACHADRPATPSADTPHLPALPEGVRGVACPVEPARNCVGCHMPKIGGIVPHTTFTDHHIRVRRREDTGR
jgi:tetratricopeptide (TPR) repeat protein